MKTNFSKERSRNKLIRPVIYEIESVVTQNKLRNHLLLEQQRLIFVFSVTPKVSAIHVVQQFKWNLYIFSIYAWCGAYFAPINILKSDNSNDKNVDEQNG